MRALLLTPYIQNDLGLLMFRLPKIDRTLLDNRFLLIPAPTEFAREKSGLVDYQGQGDNQQISHHIAGFIANPEVRSKLVKPALLKEFVGGIKQCQLRDGEYCHHELTITEFAGGFIRTCWHHDNQVRAGKIDEQKVRAVVESNIQQYIISRIQHDLGHNRTLTLADVVLFAAKHGLPLSDKALRRFFKLPPPRTDNKEFSLGTEVPTKPYYDNLKNAVLKLKVDEDPPLQYMARPKAQFIRSEKWLRWVKSQPCVCCGKQADDPHHLIGQGQGMMGGKDNDTSTIPLCRYHHNELHQNTAEFEQKYGTQAQLWYEFFTHSIKVGAIEIA